MVSAARSMPSSSRPTTPATSSAAPALSRTTSRRIPGLTAQDGLDQAGVLVRRTAAQP